MPPPVFTVYGSYSPMQDALQVRGWWPFPTGKFCLCQFCVVGLEVSFVCVPVNEAVHIKVF